MPQVLILLDDLELSELCFRVMKCLNCGGDLNVGDILLVLPDILREIQRPAVEEFLKRRKED